jgi:hypothetical protein
MALACHISLTLTADFISGLCLVGLIYSISLKAAFIQAYNVCHNLAISRVSTHAGTIARYVKTQDTTVFHTLVVKQTWSPRTAQA